MAKKIKKSFQPRIEIKVTCGSTVTIDGKRYRVTEVGWRVCGKYHVNSPVIGYAASGDKELFSITKQRGQRNLQNYKIE